MTTKDALKILLIEGNYDEMKVKKAYLAACKKYHPDVNPSGLEMMKVINEAYDTLKGTSGTSEFFRSETEGAKEYPEILNEALQSLQGLEGLKVEICGCWLWVSGNTKKHKEHLKENGFKYASKKRTWYFRPADWKSSSRGKYSMEKIRGKFGSQEWKSEDRKKIG